MNNKMLKSLLVAALTLSAAHLSAESNSTNKTFLMPRPVGVNAAMQSTTFGDLVNRKAHDKFGANFELTGFWQASADGKEQGKYFLADSKSTINVSRGLADYLPGSSVDAGLLIHANGFIVGGVADAAGATTVSLDPRQEVYGVRLDYHQDLHKLVKGLYLSANLPVVNVSNNPRLTVAGSAPLANLAGYFAGTFSSAVASNAQAALKYGKVAKRSESGVADIDVVLGYKFLNKAKYHAGLGIALTIPTGNTATGEYMFEPMVGNGKHWGLGADFCGGARLWENEESSIKLNLALKYRYLFENGERRTLGLMNLTNDVKSNMSQYNLLQVNGAAMNAALVPAANITNLPVNVTPGSQFDGNLSLSYHRGGFSLDLGYNMYAREAEDVKLKGSGLPANYAVAARAFDTAVAFDVADVDHVETGVAGTVLTNANLNLAGAETGSQFTNAIFGGAGYVFKNMDCPIMLGLGGKYEFANNNNALEQWGVWLKAGVGF